MINYILYIVYSADDDNDNVADSVKNFHGISLI